MMVKHFNGNLIGTSIKFAIIVSRFNDFITNKLLESAVDTLLRHGVSESDIEVMWTPGAFEIPQITKKVVSNGNKKYDAIICLGALMRGDTPHFDYIASEVTKGIATIALTTDIPVTYGIITADTLEQAIERSGTKLGNKGKDAALSAIEMVNLCKELS
jgi:6,7-dimethyl-8-ribityllumazine synthase